MSPRPAGKLTPSGRFLRDAFCDTLFAIRFLRLPTANLSMQDRT